MASSRECFRFDDDYAGADCKEIACQRPQICDKEEDSCYAMYKYNEAEEAFLPSVSGCKMNHIHTPLCSVENQEFLTEQCFLEFSSSQSFLECCCKGDGCNKNPNFTLIDLSLFKTMSVLRQGKEDSYFLRII
jgi:hypothetical protein